MKRLYLVRHGQTEFNVAKLVQGRCDSPLTELGRKQAACAATWLAAHDVRPDAVVSSPLKRAMDTAHILADGVGFADEVEPCEGIIERSYGSFEQGPHDALPTDVWDPGEDLVPFGGEGSRALAERMVAALTAEIEAPGVNALLAVSHGSASRQFIVSALPAGAKRPERLPNCAIMIFDYLEGEAAGDETERAGAEPDVLVDATAADQNASVAKEDAGAIGGPCLAGKAEPFGSSADIRPHFVFRKIVDPAIEVADC